MNQNRSAAGLRRSAVVERIRLREEWSALKGDDAKSSQQTHPKLVVKKRGHTMKINKKNTAFSQRNRILRPINENHNGSRHSTSDILQGIVALVDVGSETRGLALRAALAAMGASVVPAWSPLVTHVIWSQGGCRETRAKARALASKLVSPLWVEGCAASAQRLPEQTFPTSARDSDLPSPRTLRQMLKKADMENLPITLLSDDSKEDQQTKLRLRISSENEVDSTMDKSADKSTDSSSPNVRVNTVPRPVPPSSSKVREKTKKTRRNLFTHREAEELKRNYEESQEESILPKAKMSQIKLTQREKRDLAQAERIARKIVSSCIQKTQRTIKITQNNTANAPRIVLTGMNPVERKAVFSAIRNLGGRVKRRVNKRTTHVLLGSCSDGGGDHHDIAPHRHRTVNALEGAVRGCWVLHSSWAIDSQSVGKWLYHAGYEVKQLRKVVEKARVERAAFGLKNKEYVYDIFKGLRVRLKSDVDKFEAASHLLKLCGAVLVCDVITQDNPKTQYGGCDVITQENPKKQYGGCDVITGTTILTGNEDCDVTMSNGRRGQDGHLYQNGYRDQDGLRDRDGLRDQDGRRNQDGHREQIARWDKDGYRNQNGNQYQDCRMIQSGRSNQVGRRNLDGHSNPDGRRNQDGHENQDGGYDVTVGGGIGEVNSKWVVDSISAGRIRTTRRYINR